MRDLSRSHSRNPGFRILAQLGFKVFTPTIIKPVVVRGRRTTREVPVIQDLLFVNTTRERLDPVILHTETLQYRFLRGAYCKPMTVPADDMQRFITASQSVPQPTYYLPSQIKPTCIGRQAQVIGGPLNGLTGRILTIPGSKNRRLIIELPSLITAAVPVDNTLLQLLT